VDAKLITGDDAYMKARNKSDFEQYRDDFESEQTGQTAGNPDTEESSAS